jgi:DNA-binding transcriptional LysR family regulator
MTSDVGWELYRSFLAVLDEGSLSGAARSLGVAQPTVGRHIVALEKSLRLALFTRSPLGLMPTEAALSLRVFAESMHSTAAALERAATQTWHSAQPDRPGKTFSHRLRSTDGVHPCRRQGFGRLAPRGLRDADGQ